MQTVTNKPRIKQFVMVKNTAGSLTVKLEAYDFSTPARSIKFRHDQDRNYINEKWAIGVFVTPSALRQLELGYFTFEKLNVLIEKAEELGYYVPDSIKEPVITLKEMKTILRSGNINEVEKLLLNISGKNKVDFISMARSMYGDLKLDMVDFLESKLRVQLKPINLSE